MLIPRVAAKRAASLAGESVERSRESESAESARQAPETSAPGTASNGAIPRGSGLDGVAQRWRDVHVPHSAKLMLGLCAIAFGALLFASRNLDFYYDEWSFLESAHVWTLRSYFVPHNEHWSTIPMLIYKTLLHINGAHSYVPFMAVLLLMHVSVAFLLFLVVRRRCGDLLGLIAGAIQLFLGRGSDNIIWAFQIGFLGSVVFGLLALHLLGRRPAANRPRAAAGSAALLLALMSSGMGLFFLIAVGVDLALDRERRRLLWTLIVPSVAYVWWYLTFGRQGTASDHSIFTAATLEGLIGYAPAGVGTATAGVFALSSLWAPIAFAGLTATAVLLWYRKHLDTGLAIPAAVGIVLQFTLTGLVRAQYGPTQAAAPRYVYVGAVFVLLILTESLRDMQWRGLWRTAAPVAAAAVIVVGGGAVLIQREHAHTKMLTTQKYELEITWLFRAAPSLSRDVVLDRQLLPVVTPALYYDVRNRYGSPLPAITLAKLAELPLPIVNNEMRVLMPPAVSAFGASNKPVVVAPPGCPITVAAGGYKDMTVADGSTVSIEALGTSAFSQLVLNSWYAGNGPDGGDQHIGAWTRHGLRVKFPDTGRHLSWHFRVQVTGGSPVALCLGGNGS
ncbi:MAG TPA: hypothetical protein VFU74_01220 [Actinocrinis sp.]|nr:hypothetical protein [Actinocrinis sp.]